MKQIAAFAQVAKIQAVWADKPWSQTKVDQWTDALAALAEHDALAALAVLRASRERCPTIAEFVAATRLQANPIQQSDPFNKLAGDEAAATFSAVKGTGVRPLGQLADECFAAAEAYRNATQQALF